MHHFCTYFDVNYLTRGLALYRSLVRHLAHPFTLWVLCFDETTLEILTALRLPGLRLISVGEFERGDQELQAARLNRSLIEYYWTCTPSLPLWILAVDPGVDQITYLDADLLFFSSPEPVFEESGDHSILLVKHRYAAAHENLAPVAGIYNVELLTFRRDPSALAALRWWRERCIEWCYARPEDGRFGDQKYLSDWPARFSGVHVLRHTGAGVAPWNAARYELRHEGGRVYADRAPLIFYHFHGFMWLTDWICVMDRNGYQIPWEYTALVYRPYLHALHEALEEVRREHPGFDAGFTSVSVRELLQFVEQRKTLCARRSGTRLDLRKVFRGIRWADLGPLGQQILGMTARFGGRGARKLLGASAASRR